MLTKNLWKYGEFPLLLYLFFLVCFAFLNIDIRNYSNLIVFFISICIFFLFVYIFFSLSQKLEWIKNGKRHWKFTPTFLNAKNTVCLSFITHKILYSDIYGIAFYGYELCVFCENIEQRRKKTKTIRNKKNSNGATRRMYVFGRANYSCFCFISC